MRKNKSCKAIIDIRQPQKSPINWGQLNTSQYHLRADIFGPSRQQHICINHLKCMLIHNTWLYSLVLTLSMNPKQLSIFHSDLEHHCHRHHQKRKLLFFHYHKWYQTVASFGSYLILWSSWLLCESCRITMCIFRHLVDFHLREWHYFDL